MNPVDQERWLAFLEGALTGDEADAMLSELEGNPELASKVRQAALGLDSLGQLNVVQGVDDSRASPTPMRRIRTGGAWSAVWVAAASVAIAVPTTLAIANARSINDEPVTTTDLGAPTNAEPSFVLVLHGRWPDAASVTAQETQRRAREYWAWTAGLSERNVLIAAGDLAWEPGQRLSAGGELIQVAEAEVADPNFVVGMFALRVDTYEEAVALAQECPHLRFGGAVSVRQVGAGFVTAMAGDWGP